MVGQDPPQSAQDLRTICGVDGGSPQLVPQLLEDCLPGADGQRRQVLARRWMTEPVLPEFTQELSLRPPDLVGALAT